MASNDANLGILPVESQQISPDPWLTQVIKPEVVERFLEVLATATNTSGVAITHAIRFTILLPAMCLLFTAEALFRLDGLIAKNYQKLGVQ
jgi:hypothetical protein